MTTDGLTKLLDFLQMLRHKNIPYRIERQMPDALMVTFMSGPRCIEVDFFVDEIWFSVFKIDGDRSTNEAALSNLIDAVVD